MKQEFKTLQKSLEENNGNQLTYDELLLTKEWRDFRITVLRRDKHQCQICRAKGNELAWWLKGAASFNIYTRQYDEVERHYFGGDHELSSIHIQLQVHHKYYISNKYPWQYNEDVLLTVCINCHENIHKTEEIPVYTTIDLLEKRPTQKCSKCKGTGYLKEYDYYLKGICFECDGKGYEEI